MATLSKLEIEVIAQIAQLTSDLGKAQQQAREFAEHTGGYMEAATESIEGMAESFAKLAEFTGFALTVDALKEVAAHAMESAEQVEHMAQSLGLTTEAVQTMSYAAGLVGGNLDTATAALARLERSAEQAAAGTAQQVEAFRAIGISATEVARLLKDPDQLMQQVAAHLAQFGDGAGKTAVVMQIFGRGAAEMIPLLEKMGGDFEEMAMKAAAFGVVLSETDQRALVAAQESLNELGLEAKGLGNLFGAALAPAVKEVAEAFGHLLESQGIRDLFTEVGKGAKVLAENIGLIGAAAEALLAKQLVQWFVAGAAAVASVAKEAAIGASVFAELTGATAAATIGMEAYTAAGAGLLSMLGGIPGVIAIASIAVYELATSQDAAQKATASLKEAQDLLNNTTPETIAHDLQIADAAKKAAAGVIAHTQALIANLEAQNELNAATARGLGGAMMRDQAALAYNAVAANLDSLREHLKQAKEDFDKLNVSAETAHADFRQFNEAALDIAHTFVGGDIAGNMHKFAEGSNEIHEAAARMIADGANAAIVHAQEDAALQKLAASLHAADRAQVAYNAHVDEAARNAYAEDLQKLANLMDQIASGLSGPYLKALEDYQKGEDLLNKTWADAVKAGKANHDLALQLQDDQTQLEKRFYATNERIKEQHDQFTKLNDELQIETALLGVLPQQQEAVKAGLQAYNAALKANVDLYGDAIKEGENIRDVLNRQLPGWEALKQHVNDVSEAVKAQNQVLKDFVSIAQNAFDSAFQAINKDIVEGGSVMKDLVNVAKQVVQAILLEFEKLAIINPLLKSIFGANSVGNLPTLDNSGGLFGQVFGGGSGQSPVGSLMNNVLGGDSSGGGGGLFGTIANWFGGGGTDLGGAGVMAGYGSSDAFAGAVASASEGSNMYTALGGTDWGSTAGSAFGGSAGTSFLSTVSPYLLGAGAAFAGINEYQNAGGGLNGALGGATYAAGTYFAGAALATAGAIPVIGWVAIAAMLIDKFTGGDLFGTKFKPTGVTGSDINVGGNGVNITDFYQEHKHGALFSSGTYKNVDVAAPQAQIDAYNQAFGQEQSAIEQAAKALGVTVGDEITGSWAVVTDKAGKVISNTTTILGDKFNEDVGHFFERLTADNELALLGSQAQDIAKQWQSDADQLAQGTAMLLAAQVDINKGMGLLGSSDSSLADVTDIVEKLQASGENLVQTYERLQAEQESLKANLDELGITTGKTGEDFVQLADDFTKAAGSVQNADKLWSDFFKNFYSASEQATLKTAADKKNAAQLLSALGEDPSETMAQFKQDFLDKLPNLTGDQIAQWLQAGEALAAFTDDVTQSAAAIANAQQQYANYEVSTLGDAFTQSFVKIMEAEQAQIATANQLAQAAGLAGASQRDLAHITEQTSLQMASALAQLGVAIENDITALYGANITSLTLDNGQLLNYPAIQQQQAQAAAQKHAQDMATAYDLIDKLGDYSFASGKDAGEVLKAFGLSPDEIAKTLGISDDQVKAEIKAQADNAAALTKMVANSATSNGLLQDILAAIQGKPLPFDISTLGAPTVLPVSGDKPGAHTATGGDTPDTTKAIKDGTKDTVKATQSSSDRIVAALDRNNDTMNKLLRAFQSTSGTVPRNTRGAVLPTSQL